MSQTYVVCEKCGRTNRVIINTDKKPICGSCKTELLLKGAIVEGTDQSLQTLIDKCPIPVVVDVWAPWCGPCRTFSPIFETLSAQFAGKIVFVKMNSDISQKMAGKFGIRSIPTLIIFKNGTEATRQSGAMSHENFSHWLEQNQG